MSSEILLVFPCPFLPGSANASVGEDNGLLVVPVKWVYWYN